jgi:lysozyme
MSEVLHFPDVYSDDQGINFSDSYLVVAKATEGTFYTDPLFKQYQTEARAENVYLMAYHFLHHGNAAAQARYCYNLVGPKVPLAIDVEPQLSSMPSILDTEQFIDAYQNLGGTIYTVYLPKWYWQVMGTPDLDGLIERHQWLWTSNYPVDGYSDDGPGWEGYGGLPVAMWQYSSTINYGGVAEVDFNAFRGTGEQQSLAGVRAEFQHLVTTGILTADIHL